MKNIRCFKLRTSWCSQTVNWGLKKNTLGESPGDKFTGGKSADGSQCQNLMNFYGFERRKFALSSTLLAYQI